MDETGSAIGRSRSSFAQTDRYSGPGTLALRTGFGCIAADTLKLVKPAQGTEQWPESEGEPRGSKEPQLLLPSELSTSSLPADYTCDTAF